MWILYVSLILLIRDMVVESWNWQPNHTSHTNVYFNESVANVLRDNICIVIFDLWGHRGCWRPKSSLRGQKWHEEVDSLKNVLNKSFSTTSKKPLADPIIFELQPQGRKLWFLRPPRSQQHILSLRKACPQRGCS